MKRVMIIPRECLNLDSLLLTVQKQMNIALIDQGYPYACVIIDNESKKIILAHHNERVLFLETGQAISIDSTLHGEFPLADYYLKNQKRQNFPAPSKTTLVSSVDPCPMCTGALLKAGFNVGVFIQDKQGGIGYQYNNFINYPKKIRQCLINQFGYYKVEACEEDKEQGRQYQGGKGIIYCNQSIKYKKLRQFNDTFNQIFATLGKKVASSYKVLLPENMEDPFLLPETNIIKKQLRKLNKYAFTIKLQNKINQGFYQNEPNSELIKIMIQQYEKRKTQTNNCLALVDPFGNLLMITFDDFNVSLIQTATKQAVEQYNRLRSNLIQQQVRGTKKLEECISFRSLPKLRYFTFVYYSLFERDDVLSVMDMGILIFATALQKNKIVYLSQSKDQGIGMCQSSRKEFDELYKSMPPKVRGLQFVQARGKGMWTLIEIEINFNHDKHQNQIVFEFILIMDIYLTILQNRVNWGWKYFQLTQFLRQRLKQTADVKFLTTLPTIAKLLHLSSQLKYYKMAQKKLICRSAKILD